MIVLSLCDGMSCGQIALKNLGINVDKYFASEIKETGIKVALNNFPNTIEIGDVNKVSYKDGILSTEKGDYNVGKIDLVMFGSPCQTFSIAIPTEFRTGLNNLQKSGLFYQCYRVLKEVNPDYFLVENVASMKDEDRDVLTSYMGVQPIQINSSVVAPQLRNRYYWTNIPQTPIQKNDIQVKDIITSGWTDRKKAHCLTVVDSRPQATPVKIFHRYYRKGFSNIVFKSKEHYDACVKYYNENYKGLGAVDIHCDSDVFDGIRYFNQTELERCQGVPEGYTKCLTRNEAADVLGDGWTIKVIEHLLSGIQNK